MCNIIVQKDGFFRPAGGETSFHRSDRGTPVNDTRGAVQPNSMKRIGSDALFLYADGLPNVAAHLAYHCTRVCRIAHPLLVTTTPAEVLYAARQNDSDGTESAHINPGRVIATALLAREGANLLRNFADPELGCCILNQHISSKQQIVHILGYMVEPVSDNGCGKCYTYQYTVSATTHWPG